MGNPANVKYVYPWACLHNHDDIPIGAYGYFITRVISVPHGGGTLNFI